MTVIAPPGAAEDAPRVLLIDNYDSFTYNLAHLLCESGAVVDVRRHDAVTPEEAEALAPTHLVVSPGPGRPTEAGISAALIERFAGRVPVLGVCLGHQCIVEVYGGVVERARRLMHGKVGTVDRIAAGRAARRPARVLRGRPLPLAGGDRAAAGGADRHGARPRRRGHGRCATATSRTCTACSSTPSRCSRPRAT